MPQNNASTSALSNNEWMAERHEHLIVNNSIYSESEGPVSGPMLSLDGEAPIRVNTETSESPGIHHESISSSGHENRTHLHCIVPVSGGSDL